MRLLELRTLLSQSCVSCDPEFSEEIRNVGYVSFMPGINSLIHYIIHVIS
jgi:hypothetical protein